MLVFVNSNKLERKLRLELTEALGVEPKFPTPDQNTISLKKRQHDFEGVDVIMDPEKLRWSSSMV